MGRYRSIVISGPPVSGKSTLVKGLALACKLKSHSIGGEVREMWIKTYPNEEVSFEDFIKRRVLRYNKKIAPELKKLFENNNMVADSRFVSYHDRRKCLLVLVTADLKTRAGMAMHRPEYKGKSLKEIERLLIERDRCDFRAGKRGFGIDYRDPNLYHIVLNSGLLSVKEEVAIIKKAFEQK
jgi:cytidylate kinase